MLCKLFFYYNICSCKWSVHCLNYIKYCLLKTFAQTNSTSCWKTRKGGRFLDKTVYHVAQDGSSGSGGEENVFNSGWRHQSYQLRRQEKLPSQEWKHDISKFYRTYNFIWAVMFTGTVETTEHYHITSRQ